MTSKRDAIRGELDRLILQGDLLWLAMAVEGGDIGEDVSKRVEESSVTLPTFREDYEPWYSIALLVVKQVLPERLDDFVAQYKNDKRKAITYSTYTISDYLLALTLVSGVGPADAIPKFRKQANILKSAASVLDSSLADLAGVLQADLFDSELQAAGELAKQGFIRGAGAMAGVVLERHLAHVCGAHEQTTRKRHPGINDFNQLLKDGKIIDTPTWRSIQRLADLRNLCDHHGEREPTKEDITELIEGVSKVLKVVH